MYKTIVAGTDGSGRASQAVRHALALAKMSGATLHIVHVVPVVSSAVVGASLVDATAMAAHSAEMRDEGDRICSNLVGDAKREGVATEAHNVQGDPADTLLTVAEAVGADLLVVGNKGMSGMKRFVLGSVPNKVSHHCPCNLLIVNTASD